MHGVDIMALQAADGAGEAHLGGGEQRLGEIQEQGHAEDHDNDADQAPDGPGQVMSPKPVVVNAVTVK